MNRSLRALLALLALISLAKTATGEEVTRDGRHGRVVVHFEDPAAAEAAFDTVVAARAAARRLLPSGALPRRVRPTIHLYRTPADYRRAEAAITGGKFADANAFSSHARQDAHVAIEPDQDDELLRAVGLTAQTRRMIAHEAAHLALYAACENHPDHPLWLAEGFATWVADEVLSGSGVPLAEQPLASTRMALLLGLFEKDALPTVPEVLGGDLPGLTQNEKYSVWRQLFRCLATGRSRPRLRRFLGEVTRMRAGRDLAVRLRAKLEEVVGPLDRVDAAFRRSVHDLEPAWEQAYRMLEIREDGWIQLAFQDVNALAWRLRPVGRESFDLTGTLEILTPGSPQMNVLLARRERGFVSVAFRAGDGVTVFRFHAAADRWQRLGRSTAVVPEVGRRHAFRIRVRPDEIEIRLDGGEPLRVRTGSVSGPWGLGVQAGGGGIWRGVQARAP
jgi:hypothetical protein